MTGASDKKSDRATPEQSPQAVSAVPVGIPSAAWVNCEWERPVDLSERGAGFIEGFASACACFTYTLAQYPDCGKMYDPMTVDLRRATMHSYTFNMQDGGRHHAMSDYASYRDIADALYAEAWEVIAAEPGFAADLLHIVAQAIEARRAETGTGSVNESAVLDRGCAPTRPTSPPRGDAT